MKQPAAVEGDLCTGHDDFPPRPGKASSSGVYVNGKAVHVTGDQWGEHATLSLAAVMALSLVAVLQCWKW